MALDDRQKRMSALNPSCPWRGPLVDAPEVGFTQGNRQEGRRSLAKIVQPAMIDAGGGNQLAPHAGDVMLGPPDARCDPIRPHEYRYVGTADDQP